MSSGGQAQSTAPVSSGFTRMWMVPVAGLSLPSMSHSPVISDAAVSPDTPSVRSHHVGLVLFALAVGGFAIGVAEFAAMSVLPHFARGFGLDSPEAGRAISAYALGVVVGAPLLAVMGARLPRWLLLVGFMLMFALGNGVTALSPNFGSMLVFRFMSGLPHGAYFGVAALVAASLVPLRLRARAVSGVMFGLTFATIVGVPIATAITQMLDWRWAFGLVCGLALLAATLIACFAPRDHVRRTASAWRELDALRNRQVWLTLAIGGIGFGGMFSVYAYLASTLENVTRVGPAIMPWVFGVFGLGMTVGNLAGAWLADRFGMRAAAWVLLWSAAALALYPFTIGRLDTMLVAVFLIGTLGALPNILQTRLMDVAGEAQTLAAALNHSAFNLANAIGPFLAGVALAGGHGYASVGWVGVGLSLGGLALWALARFDAARLAR